MLTLEKLFYDFTSEIPEIRKYNNWKQIHILKMHSQERRSEIYMIILVWKILENIFQTAELIWPRRMPDWEGNARF